MSQVVVRNTSLEELSARAPIILLAQRIDDVPIIMTKTAPVELTDGSTKMITTEFRLWAFDVIDGTENLGRGELPGKIYVVRAYATQDDEAYRMSIEGYSTTYERECYDGGASMSFEDLGREPTILFLFAPSNIVLGPDKTVAVYSLYVQDSIERASMRNAIFEFSQRPFDDAEKPTTAWGPDEPPNN